MVPDGWKQTKLNNICTTVTSGSRDWAKYYSDSGAKFIRMTNLSRGDIWLNLSELKFVDVQSDSSDGRRTSLRYGDILMSITAELGKIGWVHEGLGEAYINQHTALIRVEPTKAHSKFIAYLLSSRKMNARINRLNDSGAKAGLNLPTIRSIPLTVPAIPIQKKIAQILSTWDKAIITTERLLANSQQQKKALMQQLLTGKKRLLDENGVRFSGEWQVSSLVTVAEVTMGSSPKSASYNESKIGLPLLQGNADLKSRLSAPRIYTSQITKECQPGDILLSVRAPVGSVGLSQHHACIGRGISAIKAKQYNSQAFLYQWLLWFEPKWEALSQGSTFESINGNDIKNILLHIPTHREQLKIASILSVADKEINALKQNLSSLKNEKKALMQQLLTGKRRVKVDGDVA